MRVLVTGGLGYIGGRIALYLRNLGHNVVISSRKKIIDTPWVLDNQIEVVNIDWSSVNSICNALSNVDIVVHAAGMNARECENNPVEAVKFNTLGTARLVSEAKKGRVRKIIYISTAHVYSDNLHGVITEKSCTNNLHPYATSHKAAEDCVLQANLDGKLQGFVFRLSNAVGAPLDKEVNCWMLLTNDICRQAVSKKEIILHSDGSQMRDFVPISTVAQVVGHFATTDVGTSNFLYNLGSGISYSVNEVASIVKDRCTNKFGYSMNINKSLNSRCNRVLNLNYKIDLLKQSMSLYDNSLIDEIDDILEFCHNNFS